MTDEPIDLTRVRLAKRLAGQPGAESLLRGEATANALLQAESGGALADIVSGLDLADARAALISLGVYLRLFEAERAGDRESFTRWLSGS